MKVYISHKVFFYLPGSLGGGAVAVPRGANLMEYSGQTLYMSEEVISQFLHMYWPFEMRSQCPKCT